MVLKKIALTGGTGMLGRHLHALFRSRDLAVVCVGRSPILCDRCWNLLEWKEDCEFDCLFDGVDAVVHAGATVKFSSVSSQKEIFDVNMRSCLNLGLWAIKRGIPLVYISGAIVYANPNKLFIKETDSLGWSGLGEGYGLSKLLGEDVLFRLKDRGLNLSVVRPSSIYGVGLDETKMVSRFISLAKEDKVIEVSQPADEQIGFIHAADVASAVLDILRGEHWRVYNVATGTVVSVEELAKACVSIVGRGGVEVAKTNAERIAPKTTFSLDISAIKREVFWQPSINIKNGIRMIFENKYLIDQYDE